MIIPAPEFYIQVVPMKKLNIALLSGGRSTEREVSLSSGRQVFDALDKSKYTVTCYDPLMDIPKIVADASKIDFALNILHGPSGEDGRLQGLLDLLDIPYQGSGVLGSAVAMNKLLAKQIYIQNYIPTPPFLVFGKNDAVDGEQCIRELGLPLIVKPVEAGSSVGMTKAKNCKDLSTAIQNAFEYDDVVMVEKFLAGKELTGGVLGNENLTALPIIEIIPDKTYDFFDYKAKYQAGETQEICPARIDAALTERVQGYAKLSHQVLFCRGYSRTDMIYFDKEIYVLETNTIPGMTQTSLLPLAAKTAGISFSQLLDQLIDLGLEVFAQKMKLKK